MTRTPVRPTTSHASSGEYHLKPEGPQSLSRRKGPSKVGLVPRDIEAWRHWTHAARVQLVATVPCAPPSGPAGGGGSRLEMPYSLASDTFRSSCSVETLPGQGRAPPAQGICSGHQRRRLEPPLPRRRPARGCGVLAGAGAGVAAGAAALAGLSFSGGATRGLKAQRAGPAKVPAM